jgi:short-subunit dehydrogenase
LQLRNVALVTAFSDHTAVITGASSGIGKATALALAAQGATLCLVGRNLDALEAVAEQARRTAPRVLSYRTDLTRDNELQELTERVQRDCGHVDLLIHSAGVLALGQIETAPVTTLDLQYHTNVRAPYVLTQALLPMLKARRGQIVFINSSLWLNARGNVGQYAATKYALKALADSLRDEVNGDGVRVMSVFPGRTASSMQVAVHTLEGKPYHPERLMQPEDVATVMINALSLPRTAEVTDINLRPLSK